MTTVQQEEIQELEQRQYVIFGIGQEEYGILINQTKEIIKPPKITNVPNTPEHVLGVINLRGQIVPVVDLHKRFNLKNEIDGDNDNNDKRIITVEVQEALIGLLVDNVNEVVWLNEDGIEPPPEVAGGIRQEFLEGVGKIEGHLLVLIDLERLLFSDNDNS